MPIRSSAIALLLGGSLLCAQTSETSAQSKPKHKHAPESAKTVDQKPSPPPATTSATGATDDSAGKGQHKRHVSQSARHSGRRAKQIDPTPKPDKS